VQQEAVGDDARIARLFQLCLTRLPTSEESSDLKQFLAMQRDRLARGELDAKAIAGSSPEAKTEVEWREQAAWTAVARSLLNLDEAIMKE
jgi:hypothetical protein